VKHLKCVACVAQPKITDFFQVLEAKVAVHDAVIESLVAKVEALEAQVAVLMQALQAKVEPVIRAPEADSLKPVGDPLDSMEQKQENTTFKSEPEQVQMPKKLTIVSCFTGCGGLDLGFEKDGRYTFGRSLDSMKHAVDTHNLNFTTKAEVCDVTDLLKDDYVLGCVPDLIMGGPPCQDFSLAGKQELGSRANMTLVFGQIICKYKPKFCIIENVPAIQSTGEAIYLELIRNLKENGYGLTIKVISMDEYGVPQSRKRLIFLGVLGWVDNELAAALEEAKTPVTSIEDYATKYDIDLGLEGKKFLYRHPRTFARRGVYGTNELYPTVRGCVRKMSPTYTFHEGDVCKNRDEIKGDTDWQLVAKMQTFPEDFKWIKKNNDTIIGNAVPPNFSKALAKIIAERSCPLMLA
jgi:DNA (cytosine-5)-methyltransferase 1